MDRLEQFRATLAIYRKHGWQLARALMTPTTLDELSRASQTKATEQDAQRDATGQDTQPDATERGVQTDANAPHAQLTFESAQLIFEGAQVFESDFDAMWFRRASAAGREAWELRLATEPYALFELFEPDEAEEDREDVRRELEARVRERSGGETMKSER
jgi:hypothetical protein